MTTSSVTAPTSTGLATSEDVRVAVHGLEQVVQEAGRGSRAWACAARPAVGRGQPGRRACRGRAGRSARVSPPLRSISFFSAGGSSTLGSDGALPFAARAFEAAEPGTDGSGALIPGWRGPSQELQSWNSCSLSASVGGSLRYGLHFDTVAPTRSWWPMASKPLVVMVCQKK